MLPGKSKPQIRRLSRGHHSAFIHQHLAPSTQPPTTVHPSAHLFIHLAIHSVSIHPSVSLYNIHPLYSVCLSVQPAIHYPSIHSHIHSVSIHSSIYPFNVHPTIQLSLDLCICSNISFPSIHSFKVQIHPSIHPLFIYPSIHHSSTQIISVYPKCSLLAFTLIPESPVEPFHPEERGGGCPGDSDTSILLPKNHSILESFLGSID